MRLNLKLEKSFAAWVLRALLGPAQIVDGFFSTISLGIISTGFGLAVAKKLSSVRYLTLVYKNSGV